MPDQRVIEQVYGILSLEEVKFMTGEDKKSFLVPVGSAGVFVSFSDFEGSTLVILRAYVLEQVDTSPERRPHILEAVNARNVRFPFGSLYFDAEPGFVVLEYPLIGDFLQAAELIGALRIVGKSADELDDELREAIGSGHRATDVWERARGEASENVGSGPVVEA